ncbi:MAG TPA: hypothetical protein VFQ50_03540, partial [Flavobacterium sp.]|nr:hypothetical protein [Flavobacterium sp.]
ECSAFADANLTVQILFMNWKIILGWVLIFGWLSEMLTIIADYSSGILKFWPLGADIACVAMIGFGAYVVYIGRKPTNSF